MSGYSFHLPSGLEVHTCPAALGYSFAAGTSDGPGAFDFAQHDGNEDTTSPVWKLVRRLLREPSKEQKACHSPKPILLDVGEIYNPYEWTPNIVDVQLFRVGQLIIIVSPGEATTMAGRRWKEAVRGAASILFHKEQASDSTPSPSPIVVIGGPANTYTHYITTEQEYSIQRYEGASTLYGPHTLAAYMNLTLSFLPHLGASAADPPSHDDGEFPPDNSNRSLSFIPEVAIDWHPLFLKFGAVLKDCKKEYFLDGASSTEKISVTFVGANPRNNLRLEGTFSALEKWDGAGWHQVRTDEDWSLVYNWRRTDEVLGTSEVEIVWELEPWAEPGRYRFKYYGDSKSLGGDITPFEGTSSAFELIRNRCS